MVLTSKLSFWERAKKRSIVVDLLAICFGISSWISINGLWVELPLLVQVLPEGWNLASYLSIIVQVANLGPVTYALIRWLSGGRVSERLSIVILLAIGTAASFLLASYWEETVKIGVDDKQTSIALFILVFFLSLVDCTSSVLFLPFMAVFRQTYLNSYLVGEGMSGFVPSVAALIQGVGGNPHCENVSIINDQNETEWEMQTVTPDPRFSVETFFYFLAVMMIISFGAFIGLNTLPRAKAEHASRHMIITEVDDDAVNEAGQNTTRVSSSSAVVAGSDSQVDNNAANINEDRSPSIPWLSNRQLNMALTDEQVTQSRNEFLGLLVIQLYVCFMSNGALPSIQTFSCLPYGNVVYHLSVTLNAMANPVMAFAAFFIPCSKLSKICGITAIGSIFVIFILTSAAYSPDMLLGQSAGGSLVVLSWVIYGGLFSYVKVSVAGMCRQKSSGALFWCGAVTQIGSAFGALLMFILVNIYPMFEGYYVDCGNSSW